MLFDARALKNEFSRQQLDDAEQLLNGGKILCVRTNPDGSRIDGKVIDTLGQEERPFVNVRPLGQPRFTMECSCEADGCCAHGIALLLECLRHPPEDAPAETSGGMSPTPLVITYTLAPHDCWPPRLQLTLYMQGNNEPPRPLLLNWSWLEQCRRLLRQEDWRILYHLREQDASWENKHRLDMKPQHLASTLPLLASSKRCFWDEDTMNSERSGRQALQPGPDRPGQLCWEPQENGQQWLVLNVAGVICFPGPTSFYVDETRGVIGQILTNVCTEALRWVERGIVVNPGEQVAFMQRHGDDLARLGLPVPVDYPLHEHQDAPTPCLRFYSLRTHLIAQKSYRRPALIDAVRVSFAYPGPTGEVEFLAAAPATQQYRYQNGILHRIERDRAQEKPWLNRLEQTLLTLTPLEHFYQGAQFTDGVLPGDLCVNSALEWQRLLLEQVPRWQEEGWRIVIAPAFRHHFVPAKQWRIVAERDTQKRYALSLTTLIGKDTLNLLPRLVDDIAAHPERYTQDALAGGHGHLLSLGDDRRVVLPLALLRPLIEHLLELFDQPKLDKVGRLTLPATQAERLQVLQEVLERYWHEPKRITRQQQLSFDEGLLTNAYEGLRATLRDYQLQGVAWWRALARRELGGILADDMGLGKTLQTLAFLLQEKNSGRLNRPVLVVAPTSVIHNWQAEAQRFTPTLSCQVLHGPGRLERLHATPAPDLFITSYALAQRDLSRWLAIPLSYLVLDEAHMIKNANTKIAKALRQFNAEHRFCLTGTPLENHLGELWSLFEFMMPGSLGNEPQFKRLYRIPIEKRRDEARAAALVRRIAPHLLRRKKADVATELPPKTEMVIPITMGDAQAHFYQALHATTQEEILQLLSAEGGEQKRIHVLDALLRLRQLCCDPRLLPSEESKALPSAKLEHLLDMLEELTEEGHRILVFSQFTSMLALISQALQTLKIPHLMLTGATQQRQAVVERFQQGHAQVFLISLKAGGVGLNLTAADTVIHFDPWWNPAAEQQATDRAYRLGQDKPVFVYKLICKNTIEEQIIVLQAQKRTLQDTITGAAELLPTASLSDEDIAFLLSQGASR